MGVSLDWEEGLFLGFRHFWRKIRPGKPPEDGSSSEAATLEPLLPRLRILAPLIGARRLEVRAAESQGGVYGDVILLPDTIAIGPTRAANECLYILRTIIAAELLKDPTTPTKNTGGDLARRAAVLIAHRKATDRLIRAFPGFGKVFREAVEWELANRPEIHKWHASEIDFETFRTRLLQQSGSESMPGAKHLQNAKGRVKPSPGLTLWSETLHQRDVALAELAMADLQNSQPPEAQKERKAFTRDRIQRVELEKEDEIEPLPIHTFEKTETLDAYKGGARKVDGSDELEDHFEALQEVDLREVTRGGPQTKSVFQADLELPPIVGDIHKIEATEKAVAYSEWDFKSRHYHNRWVKVYPSEVDRGDAGAAAEVIRSNRHLIHKLTRQLWHHRNRRQWVARQRWGSELDLDSIVDGFATRMAGHDPGEDFYKTQKQIARDFATTVLFDISLSCGSWVADCRVLDAIRQAVLVMGEVTHYLGDLMQIQCFASNTRHHCRVWTLKSWREAWPTSRHKIFGLEPQGYTRIGPAIRHATQGLRNMPQRHKLLFLLTDGKPTDFDRYEGRYGIEDVKMAVKEARHWGIETFALAFDPKASGALVQMFGSGNSQTLKHMNQLPQHVAGVYGRLTS